MDRKQILELDRKHVWHPFTEMTRYRQDDPLVVNRAEGSWLYDVDGRRYLDGNASWWVAALGHGHPRLVAKLKEQADKLLHCPLGGIAHEEAAALASDLVQVAPKGLSNVFYTDNGSTAVEVAVKAAVQGMRQRGFAKKNRIVALDGAYHGDTIGTSSLGGVEIFRRPFAGLLFECIHAPVPGKSGEADANQDPYARAFAAFEELILRDHETIASVIVEPLVQGANGMRMYAPEYLAHLRALCTAHNVWLIVDEVFTGYGRTGTMFACEHAGIVPDMMCLGKAFSSVLPMGAMLATDEVSKCFEGSTERALLYGHTFCGHPLGAAIAREVLAVYRDEEVLKQVARKAPKIAAFTERLGRLGAQSPRALGMIGAVDLSEAGYLGTNGWRVYEEARKRGAYLRPLGDTVYVCPPLVITDNELDDLLAIVEASVAAALAAVSC
jgi:adenosylmethionine---8-amino-7-oxononanoate aminotransferase